MADATKQHIAGNEGTFFVSEIKTLFSILKSKRTMAFAYGVMFAFVVFTAFLAFNPSPNSSSPWFSNIFSVGSSPSSDRSHFSSVLSFFFPNNSSSRQQREAAVSNSSSITQTNFTRSISGGSESPPGSETYSVAKNTTFQSPVKDNSKNQTQTGKISDKPVVLLANQTMNSSRATKQPLAVKNQTINSQNPTNPPASKQNQTTIPSPKSPLAAVNQSEKSISKGVSEKGLASNYTSSLSKKQSNVTDAAVSAKQGIENWMQSLMNCDFFDGEWVMDDSYPLYKPGSCKLIDEQFNCILNGRPDTNYQKYKWKPKGCSLPRSALEFSMSLFLRLIIIFFLLIKKFLCLLLILSSFNYKLTHQNSGFFLILNFTNKPEQLMLLFNLVFCLNWNLIISRKLTLTGLMALICWNY